MLKRFLRIVFLATVICLMTYLTVWTALAFWYRLPVSPTFRTASAAGFAVFGLMMVLAQFGQRRVMAQAAFVIAFALVYGWWNSITPPADGNWAPDVARQVTGRIDGNNLTLDGVREFEWHSETDAAEVWSTRTYDLSTVQTTDLFMSYWAGPSMAHLILSFGFENGDYLAWSVEVRRQIDGGFSPVADFFKANTLAIVAAAERDVVGVRSNIRGEDVQIYRLNTAPEAARKLIEQYVRDANALAEQPEFFNSVFTNCSTSVFRMMASVGSTHPFDWRIIVNGYLPEYAYDREALDMTRSLEELRSASHIADKALAHTLAPGFAQAIREGVPSPLAQ